MKTTVSLPDELVAAADALAERLGVCRMGRGLFADRAGPDRRRASPASATSLEWLQEPGRRVIREPTAGAGFLRLNMAGGHMHVAPDSIEALLLRLPARDRARIAELLLASLDEEADPDVDVAWAEEAERRLAELRAGTVAGVPSEHVHARIQDALRRGEQRED